MKALGKQLASRPFARAPRPEYFEMRKVVTKVAFPAQAGEPEFYGGPMIGAEALAARFLEDGSGYVHAAQALLERLSPDDYTRYLLRYYETGLQKFGKHWAYADIVTVLLGLAAELEPAFYLEVGVRRGRSACAVGSRMPGCTMVLFDKWLKDYARMENPGAEFVRVELMRIGHRGPITFIDGDSHETLPRYLTEHPDMAFDLITVDGDHSDRGAAQDLADVLPRLKIGGAIVFDDVAHPSHPGLGDVWRRIVVADRRFSAWTFDSVGFGVGFALRKY
jgi:predicted O-methyltransferase YrrM